MRKKVFSIFLILILMSMYILPVMAVTQSDVEEMKEQQEKVENQKEEVTEEKKSVMDEISELTVEISKYESEIAELNDKINELETSITSKETEIKELEKETEEKQELLIERLVAMYESGQTTYLDVLLSSEDMTTLISNYYRIKEIAEADQQVIDSIIQKQEETEKVKNELEEEKQEIKSSKSEVEQKNNSLQTAKATKQQKVNSLSAEEKELQAKIDEFEEAIKDAQEEIRKATEEVQDNGSGYDGSFEGIFAWPLSNSCNIITSVFGYRDSPTAGASSNHGAIDIAVNYVPVYAPADGKVIIARYLSGYGNYIMIDHGNGYYTGFGHLSSYNVSQGQVVSRGQQIAVSGNTGVSTGPHLHYEVYIGGTANSYRVDPLQYTSHPSLIYS